MTAPARPLPRPREKLPPDEDAILANLRRAYRVPLPHGQRRRGRLLLALLRLKRAARR
jgi:hypothetical protein